MVRSEARSTLVAVLMAALGLIGCAPASDGPGGTSGSGRGGRGSITSQVAGQQGAAGVQAPVVEPEPVDPFEGWTEEQIAEWQRARRDRVRRVFSKVLPPIEEAAERYEEHGSLERRSLFGRDQRDNQESIDRLLDKAVEALELSSLDDVRTELRGLEDQASELERRLARDREARVSAPRSDEVNAIEDAITVTVEEYDARIAQDQETLEGLRRESDELVDRFVDELRAVGVELDREAAEGLLAAVSGDEFIKLCAVFDNVRLVTEQLQELTEQSGENLETARRYYGVYVVLIRIMDRLQLDFVAKVREEQIPRLRELASQARDNIVQAERNLRRDGDPTIGAKNITANRLTIQATEIYVEYLSAQATDVERQNARLQPRLRDAVNTYETVRVASQVAEILRESARDLDTLLNLEVPRLRAFENSELQAEFMRLTEELGGLQ
ncbi:hypothetical protein [Engelhardtia mirabilis]|uniref:Uncharacterized protein n=1 Tax=Engelhardtia mirabilis TaxID=2528011 RepID=A0A518BNK9_9BACT|nr:hypothetical protein Pla133_36640 [Planctomycetes bacterium Pla133]QDV02890.1 hypothetical protein Pla86_36620 [Planctomycetes bacterium Pla86]